MGNSTSEHQARFFRTENLSNDPSAFRVFVKKKNKFIPGWLKINDDEIVFTRGGNHFQYWSLAHLRRYGYTCSGVFFFESGRRCATGEGLHTFQSHQAERIFHMVQSKIKIEEYARGSRAGSVASGRINSLVPTPSASSRIHPVQRFSSEGANNEYSPPNGGCLAPPPYSAFQDARRHQQNASPNCPSVITAVSSSAYARIAALRERPRSVVSNIEHNVVMPPMQQQQQQFRHHHINPIQGNASSSTLLQHLLNQQQQHQQGFAMPPHMNSPLAGSSSGSCLMNQSYHSALGTGSPWASQQQLEGDIVMEHVLGDDGRRRVLPGGRQNTMPNGNNKAGGEPIRVAVPPSAKSPAYGTTTNFFGGGTKGCREQPHAYVNVNLPAGQQQGNGVGLNVRELHRTDRSRLEFLSTGPGAFQLPHYGSPNGRGTPNNNFYTPTPPPPAGGPSSAFAPPLPSAMQHSYHQQFYACTPTFTPPYHQQQQHQLQQHYFQNHQNLQMPREQHLMSQSVSGALPPFSGRHFVVKANEPSSLLYTSNSSSLEQIVPPNDGAMVPMLNYQYCPPDASKVASAGNGSEQAGLQGNNGSNSTLITSSSNTMATTTGS